MKDTFFQEMGKTALTFDDVRVATRHCSFELRNVDMRTRFSTNVPLKIPIVSAAMDTVTEQEMAIALASLGGIGVIHRNLDMEAQSKQVRAVKLYLGAKITTPICMSEDISVEEVLKICHEKGYGFRSFPIHDNEGCLVGILTGNDIEFCMNKAVRVADAMTRQVVTGHPHTEPKGALLLMSQNKIKVLPLVDDYNKVVGMYLWSDLQRALSEKVLHNTDQYGRLRVAAAVSTSEETMERVKLLVHRGVDVIVIDAAHADSIKVFETFEQVKQEFPNLDVVVGNISEPDSAKKLAEMGVDGIKVGQGGGSICTTRVVAGIGTPQVTAIYNCVKAVRDCGKDIPVCGDGGIREPGDITIAIAAGADSVMLGGMLAGTDEAPGEMINTPEGPMKAYRGMGSLGAMLANEGSRGRYNETNTAKDKILPEGIEALVPYSGSLERVIHRYTEGLRRGMGYSGSASLKELQRDTMFWRVTNAGMIESRPHDVKPISR